MDTEWISKRPYLAPVVARMNELLEHADALIESARGSGESVDYGAFEEEVAARTAQVEAAIHEAALSSLDLNAPFVRVWGKTYRRVHRAPRTYGTLAGPVTVHRTLYREVGLRTGPSLDVVAQRAGVVDRRWLPRTARAMAHLLGQGTSREAKATSVELLRLPYSRCSFERVAHAVGEEYVRRRRQVEPRLIEALEIPPEARAISVAIDRVAVPMEEPAPPRREAGPPSEEELALIRDFCDSTPLDGHTRALLQEAELQAPSHPPPKVERNYRMAYCATVSLHDEAGRALHTIRYGRMPPTPGSIEAATHREVTRLMERLRDDVKALRAARPELPVVLLADGAPELWKLFDRHLAERHLGVAPVQLVDAWHALEYVASAARLAESRRRAPPGTFRQWRESLLDKERGVDLVVNELRALNLETVRDEAGKRPVGDAIRYLERRAPRMNYADAKAQGFPIGSGTVEATCKTLVSTRMKRAGSRWKPKTGNEILQLRALQVSDRWGEAMRLTLKPLRKSVHIVNDPYDTRRTA